MSARTLDGNALARRFTRRQKSEVAELVKARGVQPGLATVLVGTDAASRVYVSMKQKRAAKVEIEVQPFHEPDVFSVTC